MDKIESYLRDNKIIYTKQNDSVKDIYRISNLDSTQIEDLIKLAEKDFLVNLKNNQFIIQQIIN